MKSKNLSEKILRSVKSNGFKHIELPSVIETNHIVQRSGESFRKFIFSFIDQAGNELCIRPDLTIVSCLRYLENNLKGKEKIFDNLSFTIDGKKTVAIVGATGSGKSTLAYLLPRLYEIESGSIEIDGININDLKLNELRSNVSLAFEESFLFSNSARENISLGLDNATQEEVEKAALTARAHEFISLLPESYETKVGERGYGLSGGQRQRIALARAILRKPRVLILDDALSAVDASTEEEIRNELQAVMKNMTTLIITNRAPTIELCDEVIFIENGSVKAQGTHTELIDNIKSYKSLFLENESLDTQK